MRQKHRNGNCRSCQLHRTNSVTKQTLLRNVSRHQWSIQQCPLQTHYKRTKRTRTVRGFHNLHRKLPLQQTDHYKNRQGQGHTNTNSRSKPRINPKLPAMECIHKPTPNQHKPNWYWKRRKQSNSIRR